MGGNHSTSDRVLSLVPPERALAPVDVVGIGIGGWIAAQMMAVMYPQHIRHLVLVDAAGVHTARRSV